MHLRELQSRHAELVASPAPQLDAALRSYKIFSFTDTSLKIIRRIQRKSFNLFQRNVEDVRDNVRGRSVQARKP